MKSPNRSNMQGNEKTAQVATPILAEAFKSKS